MERAMRFEPTTASLEGWNSTTELRPPLFFRAECPPLTRTDAPHSGLKPQPYPRLIYPPLSPLATTTGRARQTRTVWWAGKDSNLGRHKPADLQSAPFGH